jgi:hypothetical protein
MRTFVALACLAACLVSCSGSNEVLGLLGWNMSVSNLRWDDDYLLIDVDAAPTDPKAPLSVPPDRLTGTVCLGPLKDRSEVRGVYTYSPRDRMPKTTVAYGAAFPVGVLPTNGNDTGVMIKTTSLSAWRADGTPVTKAQLGDPAAFAGNGYMLLGLEADAIAARGTATTPPAGAAR